MGKRRSEKNPNPAVSNGCVQLQKCPLCTRTFPTIGELRIHIPSHTREKPFKCQYCDFRTTWKQCHQTHMERNHDRSTWETRLRYKCDFCPLKFHLPATLRLHMLTHSVDREYFPCKFPGCTRKSTSSTKLKAHYIRVHRGIDERPFACQLKGCGYRARFSDDLRQHQITHRSDRPFRCSEATCGYTAKIISALNRHIKTRHGDVSRELNLDKVLESNFWRTPLSQGVSH